MTSKKIVRSKRIALLMLSAIACMGCSPTSMPPAASVDGNVVSQQAVALALPDAKADKRQAQLDAFVSEQLLADAAVSEKLDGQDDIRAALEIARRTTLARAYVSKLRAAIPAPAAAAVQDFYDKHPALFSKRRIYRLQEIAIAAPAERVNDIKEAFRSQKTFNDRASWLKKEMIPFKVGVTVKPAEELPSELVADMLQMSDGTTFDLPSASGFTTVQITGIEEKPVTLAQAQAFIQTYLLNQQAGKVIEQETARLRKAATVQYFTPYAGKGT